MNYESGYYLTDIEFGDEVAFGVYETDQSHSLGNDLYFSDDLDFISGSLFGAYTDEIISETIPPSVDGLSSNTVISFINTNQSVFANTFF